MRVRLVEQAMKPLGMIRVGTLILLARMVVAVLGSSHYRVLIGMKIADQVQHRSHQCSKHQQHKEAGTQERSDGGRRAEHGTSLGENWEGVSISGRLGWRAICIV